MFYAIPKNTLIISFVVTIEYMSMSDNNGQTEMRSTEIDPSFSNYTLDETMEILKNFHDGYNSSKTKTYS